MRTSLHKTNETIKQNSITYQKEIKSSYVKFSPSILQDEDEQLAVFLERNYSQKKIRENQSPKNSKPTITECCQTNECFIDKNMQYEIDILKEQLNYEAKMKEEKENYYNIQINMLKYSLK